MTAPVSVCLIVRNEIAQLERCLASIRPHVAEIVVVDTGSTDSSQEVARRYADRFEVYTGCNHPNGLIRSFSDARQKSFSLATQPWTMWVDGDDEVVGAEHLEKLIREYDVARAGSASLVTMPYEYGHDHHGNVTCIHPRERLIAPREEFRWMGRVHEVLTPLHGDVRQHTDLVKIVHRRDSSGKKVEHGRNLRILKEQYADEGEKDVRHLYYLGMEYGYVLDPSESPHDRKTRILTAIGFLSKYVDRSGWDDERYNACLLVADHFISLEMYDEALQWASKASLINEQWGEAFFTIAKCFYLMAHCLKRDVFRNWNRCIHYAKHGLSLPPTKTGSFLSPLLRNVDIHTYLNLALTSVGRVDEALESVREGLKHWPDDKNLLFNEALFVDHLAKMKIAEGLSTLVNTGKMSPAVRARVDQIVSENHADSDRSVQADPPIQAVSHQIQAQPPQTIAPRLGSGVSDIVFFTGNAVEKWNPETAAQHGIGGSETAVIEMAKRLVQRGCSVRVFNECAGIEGTFDGVQYVDYKKYGNLDCDVLITSRRPSAVDDSHNVRARARMCWVHDIHCGPELTHARAIRIDRFLTLTNWHRDFFLSHHQCVHPGQVSVTRNGIDLARFDRQHVRDPKRAVYSSSPDRGMQVAITVWPLVRERVPGAELHVYYGFKTWEACADDNQKVLIQNLKKMLKDYETAGVVYHDRVSQSELADEFLKSGVWAYPTWFSETSCISAMEAQAAGLFTVTSPIAALNETVGPRGAMISGDWLSWDYQSRFVDAVVDAMKNDDPLRRKAIQAYARSHFGWDSLADEWIDILSDVVQEASDRVMPPYKGVL